MSIVNTETGELLDSAAAERRAERISLRLDTIADNYAAVMPMIRDAIEQRDDLALGYRSPGDYVKDRFGGSLQRLGVEVRRAVVGELSAAGMSTRAIAPVVAASQSTVRDDVKANREVSRTTHLPQTPESGTALGPVPVEAHEPRQAEGVDPSPTLAPVVGIDGKTYTRPAPRAVPRPAAERTLASIQTTAAKAAREAETLTPDQIRRVRADAGHITASLRHSIETLQRLADALTPMEDQ